MEEVLNCMNSQLTACQYTAYKNKQWEAIEAAQTSDVLAVLPSPILGAGLGATYWLWQDCHYSVLAIHQRNPWMCGSGQPP